PVVGGFPCPDDRRRTTGSFQGPPAAGPGARSFPLQSERGARGDFHFSVRFPFWRAPGGRGMGRDRALAAPLRSGLAVGPPIRPAALHGSLSDRRLFLAPGRRNFLDSLGAIF